MKQITEDYCSYEIAKLLKEKGFDGECQGYYEVPTKLSSKKDVCKQLNVLPKNWNEYNKECVVCEYVSIPTHQMALKWLREVYKYVIVIDYKPNTEEFFSCIKSRIGTWVIEYCDSYEQAVEAALKYTLENLI